MKPVPGHIAASLLRVQLPLRLGGDKAPTQQAMAQQLGKPGRVFHIGFPARHRLDVLRIYHEQFELAFQQIIDRTPVYASRNLAKKMLEWEYGIEIERTRLLIRPEEQ